MLKNLFARQNRKSILYIYCHVIINNVNKNDLYIHKNDFFFMIQHMRLLNKIRMRNSVYVYVYPFEFFVIMQDLPPFQENRGDQFRHSFRCF